MLMTRLTMIVLVSTGEHISSLERHYLSSSTNKHCPCLFEKCAWVYMAFVLKCI